jgi:predicted metal-dependent peptidase
MIESKGKLQILKARSCLVIDQPFFASILLPMPMHESTDIDTFGTDGDSIIYNPNFANELTQEETTFILAHEVLHCVFDHMGRRGNKNHNKWNIAADYIINDLLVNEKIGTMPKGGLLDSKIVAKGNGTAEGVYNILPKDAENKKPGSKGGSLDSVSDSGSKQGKKKVDAAKIAEKSAKMKVRVIQARNAAKMQGTLSMGMERLLVEVLKPIVDWKNVLRRFISEKSKTEYSFARPKRRFLSQDLYLPSLNGEILGKIVIAVDCSGSIDDRLLNKFSAEINAIREDSSPSLIEVHYFDTTVLKTETFEAETGIKLNPIGGGGTAFSPVFKKINESETAPIACIFLTDLVCSDFGPCPAYPVLWTVLEKSNRTPQAPFGEIVQVSKD